jgi:hypothetical protein
MEQFLNITKKYGVTGVLAMWLWHTDSRLTKVEEELYECYKARTEVSGLPTQPYNIGEAILTDNKLRVIRKRNRA